MLCKGFLFLTMTASSSWQQWKNSIGQRLCDVTLSFAADTSKVIIKIYPKENALDGKLKEKLYTLSFADHLSPIAAFQVC